MVGRDKNGRRTFETLKPDYSFYYADPNGQYKSIYGESLNKITVNSFKSFQREQKQLSARKLFETDIKPVFKALEQNYLGSDLPILHKAPIDIETGFSEERGFASPDDPHQPITAISVNYDWLDQMITLVLKPQGMTDEEAEKICQRFENCFLFTDEGELLKTFYDVIDDTDILYTWNGEGFDIPYIVNRTIKVLGKEYTRKFSHWDMLPKKRTYEKYGKEQNTYDLSGRVHLDYLNLYRKYTYHEMHSYRLDAIGEYELGENKIPYEGTLDALYNNDFEKFIAYNRQDVALLTKLENKLKFIDLTNILAHENCVLFSTTMGAVGLTDQALVLEAHRRGMQVPARVGGYGESKKIAGAYVANPKRGLSKWLGTVDITSLYPSVIRALNMSPETLVAQIRQDMTNDRLRNAHNDSDSSEEYDEDDETNADKWGDLFACLEYTEVMNQTDTKLLVDVEGEDEPVEMTAKEIYEWIFENESNLCMSANGTIFKTDVEGLIPGLLTTWFADRKEMQKKKKEYDKLVQENYNNPEKLAELKYQRDYWDHRQMARKINLNACYGAITNQGSRFSDQRIGQSTTLSGRTISKHMASTVNEAITGEYIHNGEAVIYGDTDSVMFSVSPVLEDLKAGGFEINKDNFVELSNNVAEQVNDSFPAFMVQAFNTSEDRKGLIKCGRELCATNALFVKKKRYAILYYDKENSRKDYDNKPGDLKIMGMDTQRADTPKPIQEFLKDVLLRVLKGDSEKQTIDHIREFRTQVKILQPWEKGTPKRVNNLTIYEQKMKAKGKVTVPGHVRASINWNSLRRMNNDSYALPISDGQKVIVCKLKNNPLGYTSIAYPVDEFHLPKWFKELPFDSQHMEEKLIDQKLDNIIGVLGWQLNLSKLNNTFVNLFELE